MYIIDLEVHVKGKKEAKVICRRGGGEERDLKNETRCHDCMCGYQYASSKRLQLNSKISIQLSTCIKLFISI